MLRRVLSKRLALCKLKLDSAAASIATTVGRLLSISTVASSSLLARWLHMLVVAAGLHRMAFESCVNETSKLPQILME